MPLKEKKILLGWSICPHLHAMNDVAHKPDGSLGRPATYRAECYRILDGEGCPHAGKCIQAHFSTERR